MTLDLAALTGWSAQVFLGVMQVSLQCLICLALIVVLRRVWVGRASARWQYALWFALILRMVIPANLPWAWLPWPSLSISTQATQVVASAAPRVVKPRLPRSDAALSSVETAAEQATRNRRLTDQGTTAPNQQESDHRQGEPNTGNDNRGTRITILLSLLCVIWFSGMGIVLLRAIVNQRRHLRRLLHHATQPAAELSTVWVHACRELDIRSWPVVLVSDDVSTPVLLGALRPKILLPRKLVRRSTQSELRYYVLHELVHLRAGDIWLTWVWLAAIAIHWFNPFLWWAGVQMRNDRELACDERLLKLLGHGERAAYGRALLKAVLTAAPTPWPVSVAGLAGVWEQKSSKAQLERRIEMISRPPNNSKVTALLAWSAALIVASLTFAQRPAEPQPTDRDAIFSESSEQSELSERSSVVQQQEAAQAPRPANQFANITDESKLATRRDAAARDGKLLTACAAEMRRVKVRDEIQHAYKDKIDLTKIWDTYTSSHGPPSDQKRQQIIQRLQQYADQHRDDPDYGWRIWHLCAAIAEDANNRSQARRYLARAIATYPYVKYRIASKHSKFQHLINEAAMMIWDEQGVAAAERYVIEKWQNDRRFVYFFDHPWQARYRRESLGNERVAKLKSRLGDKPPLRAVTVTLTPDGPEYKGELLSWKELRAQLQSIPDPMNCYLAMDVSTDELTLKQWQSAQSRAMRCVEQLHFDHFSDIGLRQSSDEKSD